MKLAITYPKEGAIANTFGACLPKTAPNPEGAYIYLNAMLARNAMAQLATASFYAPANTKSALPATADLGTPALPLAGPGVLFVTLFLLLPLGMMLRYSLDRFMPGESMQQALTLENYARFLHDPFYQGVLGTTLRISALSTTICAVAGFPVAYCMARTAGPRLKLALMIAVVLPLLMGNSVRTVAWMVLLGSHGLLTTLAARLGLSAHLAMMYTPSAVVIGLVSVLLPFMIITVQSTLENADRSVEEAAASIAITRHSFPGREAISTILLAPIVVPGIVGGAALYIAQLAFDLATGSGQTRHDIHFLRFSDGRR